MLSHATRQPFWMGGEQVIANQLDLMAHTTRQFSPGRPVLLAQSILDGDHGVVFHPIGQHLDHVS